MGYFLLTWFPVVPLPCCVTEVMANRDLACSELLLVVLKYRDLLFLSTDLLLEMQPLLVLVLDLRQLGLEQTNFLCCLFKRS